MNDEAGDFRRWADGFRHAADNKHYHLDPVTARETATRFDQAARTADELAELRAAYGRLATENGELEARVDRLMELREQLGRERDSWRARYWWEIHGHLVTKGHPNEKAASMADARCAEVARSMRDFPSTA